MCCIRKKNKSNFQKIDQRTVLVFFLYAKSFICGWMGTECWLIFCYNGKMKTKVQLGEYLWTFKHGGMSLN
ncbi:hypothetical protein DFR62_3265 [Planococcus citreus]|uniref:Uncharacterized protein n=1 Tax=Planococcus citreus TaxID=1373 RepID=A0A497YC86_9BACL|nr:hypothetical protein DFR62_3265 [Planococcus citreus]